MGGEKEPRPDKALMPVAVNRSRNFTVDAAFGTAVPSVFTASLVSEGQSRLS